VKRREFITLLGGVAAWPLASRAQQVRRVGMLMDTAEDNPEGQRRVTVFRQQLKRGRGSRSRA
jgi:putative ABC transport system substrate-binding protein